MLGTITTQLPRATAGANSDTKPSSGATCGQIIPTTPTGSCNFTVAPHSGVSWKHRTMGLVENKIGNITCFFMISNFFYKRLIL